MESHYTNRHLRLTCDYYGCHCGTWPIRLFDSVAGSSSNSISQRGRSLASEWMSERACEWGSEWVSECVIEGVTERVSERVTERKRASEWVREWPSERVIERASECGSDRASACEWASERARSELMSEWVNDGAHWLTHSSEWLSERVKEWINEWMVSTTTNQKRLWVVVMTGQLLLALRHVHQEVRSDETRQFRHDRHVLRHRSRHFLERRVSLDKRLCTYRHGVQQRLKCTQCLKKASNSASSY